MIPNIIKHCLHAWLKVRLGEHDKRITGEGILPEKTVNVSALHIHRDFDRNGNTENDVALLELAEDVDLNTYTPACMAEVLAHLVYVLYFII